MRKMRKNLQKSYRIDSLFPSLIHVASRQSVRISTHALHVVVLIIVLFYIRIRIVIMLELLIDLVKRHEAIYNTKAAEYRDCAARHKAWANVAELCGSTGNYFVDCL